LRTTDEHTDFRQSFYVRMTDGRRPSYLRMKDGWHIPLLDTTCEGRTHCLRVLTGPNPCHPAFVPHPTACCLQLLTIYPCVYSLGRCWDPRSHAICSNTDLSFDPDQRGNCSPTDLVLVAPLEFFGDFSGLRLSCRLLFLSIDSVLYWTNGIAKLT
jgi:hypothetical protein